MSLVMPITRKDNPINQLAAPSVNDPYQPPTANTQRRPTKVISHAVNFAI
ncbi:MAG TPA: hypothetical protein VJ142_01735 [Candidatus Nanoarchaeia archaeon]|nr:hypothetical protein [Candidatus Nanoarchaeia archaeon]